MRKLSISLLAALAFPTAVNAESHWLILHYWNWNHDSSSMVKVEMESAMACQKEGEKWEKSTTLADVKDRGDFSRYRRYHCVVGK